MRRGLAVADRGPRWSYRPDGTRPSVFGVHQPGIATPQLDHLSFAAFDIEAGLRERLAAWTAEAERLMDDSLTLTLGLGPGVFDSRFGLARARPAALAPLPAFAGDALDPARCGGDVCVLACAREPEVAREALERLAGAARVRWRQDGFLRRDPGPRARKTPRDLLGFRHGTGNPRRPRDLDRHVWIDGRERSWLVGGTLLVVRRIRIDLERWHALSAGEQEQAIGRHRAGGAPLGLRAEFDPFAPEQLPPRSHVRLAAPRSNGGATMLRRGYSYDDGRGDAGMLLLAYMRDPRRQFVPVQRRLAEHDALAEHTHAVGSAVFAIPPGARPDGFIGSPLLAYTEPTRVV
jgi:deferrochelatase/peroxidase EfeB